jgi:hypothetical protein
MMNFTDLPSVPLIVLHRLLIICGWQWPLIWPGSRAHPASTLSPTCVASCPGALGAAWTHWLPAARRAQAPSGTKRPPRELPRPGDGRQPVTTVRHATLPPVTPPFSSETVATIP